MHYYLNANAQQEHGEHELHKETCSELPRLENRIDIGPCSSDAEALNKAKILKPSWLIDGCKWCYPTIHKL